MGKKNKQNNTSRKYTKNSPDFELYLDDQIKLQKQITAIEKTVKGTESCEWLNWFRGVFEKALENANPSQLKRFNSVTSAENIRRLIIEQIVATGRKTEGQDQTLITLKNLRLPLKEAI